MINHFIPGLFVAGVFSGALSTVSSGLNSLAAVTLQVRYVFIETFINLSIHMSQFTISRYEEMFM